MKAIYRIALLVVICLFVTSCSIAGDHMHLYIDNNKLADETFDIIVDAVNTQEPTKIYDLFSDKIQNENDMLNIDAQQLVKFIEGNIISVSDAEQSGVSAHFATEYGTMEKAIEASCAITTTENKYYMAMRECIIDESNNSNVGVQALYIIEADKWPYEYVYRGDGFEEDGIHLNQIRKPD